MIGQELCSAPPETINDCGIKKRRAQCTEKKDLLEVESMMFFLWLTDAVTPAGSLGADEYIQCLQSPPGSRGDDHP